MMGDRDSEIAIVFKDPQAATELRIRLWSEHLGLEPTDFSTSALDDLVNWKRIGHSNTNTFVNLFEYSIAEAEPLTLKQYAQAFTEIRGSDILFASDIEERLKSKISGHLVEFPVRFLHNEFQNTLDIKQATFQQIKEIGGLFMDDLFR